MWWLKFIGLAFILSHINHVASENITCPDLKVVGNLTNPYVAQSIKRDLIRATFEIQKKNNPSALVQRLREIILKMSEADSFYFTEIAYEYAAWSAGMLSEAENVYPNLCPFASIINKTAEWELTGNLNKYLEALNESVEALPYSMTGTKFATLNLLGCSNNSKSLVNFNIKPCYQNGLVSNQNPIWEKSGELLPWTLCDIVQLLQDSPLFVDRAHATILTFVTTSPQQYFFTRQDYPNMFEYRKYFINAANNSKCCCNEWSSKMDLLIDINYQKGKETVEEYKKVLEKC